MSHTLPSALIHSLHGIPGFDEAAFVQAHEANKAITSIRVNPNKPIAKIHFENATPVPWCYNGYYLKERPSFTLDPVFHGGAYYVQEASSMFLDHVVKHISAVEIPKHVLDLCGAPGGKSTLLAAALPNSFIVSNEVIKTRVSILAENISKWGSGHVIVTNNDPKEFSRLPAFFDLMVIDAPCSGSGLFRKDAKAMNEWSEANVNHCSMRQQRILADAIPSLRNNGYLVYSTCSYSKLENEDICDWIIDQFNLTPVEIPIDAPWGIVTTKSEKHKATGYRFYPDKVNGEGFFIACFKQQNAVEEYYAPAAKLHLLPKGEKEIIERWIQQPGDYILFQQKENIVALPAQWTEAFSIILKNLSVRKSGIAIGFFKGKDMIPHHEFALSNLESEYVTKIEVDKHEALKYLKRQDLVLNAAKTGWTIINHEGINLGWAKVLPTRVNNYYPTNWRILIP